MAAARLVGHMPTAAGPEGTPAAKSSAASLTMVLGLATGAAAGACFSA
jgi:hypothetical protein